jgi:hypothetical protein
MSSVLEKLPEIDLKRSLAHVFPGFLLFIGLIMATDAFLFEDQVLTAVLFKPTDNFELLTSLILVGLFVGSILGVMIDGIGHWAFEERWFNVIVENEKLSRKSLKLNDGTVLTIGAAEKKVYEYWMNFHEIQSKGSVVGTPDQNWPKSPEYLYPFTSKISEDEDKVKLKDQLVSDYYSYFEFYLNSALAVVVVALIIPFYAVGILDTSYWLALFICGAFLGACLLLLFAAIHTLADYKRARLESIEGYLRKKKKDT